MTVINDIRQALDAKLQTASGLPALAFQNVKYAQAPRTPHIRVQFIPTSRRPANRGPSPQHRHQGLYTLTACTETDKGAGAALDYVDALLALFNGSSDVIGAFHQLITSDGDTFKAADSPSFVSFKTSDTVNVSIDYSESQSPYEDEPFYCVPVQVSWYAYE